ncbi:AbrB/MazE/SpoVT family DNA-binding domain-containing protein [Streptococcus halichoeri]|uniref:AbrB/MazE/SpoVT family DNA-binding domain-containing protein n=1 Tax=Streptococcus halichoeri TaxID=254785 RepID=UPI000DB87CF7|nr:AbrB/MazE/SpoVT family DNA-binding domain-containing protein [Streptococcus halichoeri]PZO95818.1 MAG: AbrB/MazE/SpoVT family DNA-binding domain-containing protein [Streptococcus pyogenes]
MALVLQKWGNSSAIRLPKKVVDELNWHVNQELEFSVTENCLTLKTRNRPHIKRLFAGFEGRIEEKEVDWGASQGSEIW